MIQEVREDAGSSPQGTARHGTAPVLAVGEGIGWFPASESSERSVALQVPRDHDLQSMPPEQEGRKTSGTINEHQVGRRRVTPT